MKPLLGRFLFGLLYGVAWFAALANTAALVLQLILGIPESGRFLPAALGSWGLILFVHWTARWFPFRPRG